MAVLKYWDPVSQTYKSLAGPVAGPAGPQGPQGPAGAAGPAGPIGPQFAPASSGLWVPIMPFFGFGAGAMTAGTLRFTRIRVEQAVDTVQFEVTGSSTGNLQVGVWADSGATPGTLLISSALVSTNLGGIKTTPLALQPGYYWIGTVASAAPSVRVANSHNPLLPGIDASAVSSTMPSAWTITGVTVGSLPNTIPMGSVGRSSSTLALFLRAA